MSIFDNIKPLAPAWPARPWNRKTPRPVQEKDTNPRGQQRPAKDQQEPSDKPGHIDEFA
jgi:hypothetical protein